MTLRQDGFIALRARDGKRGRAKTIALEVSGTQLVATADTAMDGSSIQISIGGKQCTMLRNDNVSDFPLGGCGSLKTGSKVVLEVQMSGQALLYTLGFTTS